MASIKMSMSKKCRLNAYTTEYTYTTECSKQPNPSYNISAPFLAHIWGLYGHRAKLWVQTFHKGNPKTNFSSRVFYAK